MALDADHARNENPEVSFQDLSPSKG